MRLVQVVDQTVGYVAPTAYSQIDAHSDDPHAAHAHHHAQQTTTQPLSSLYHTSTVQEKWVDHPEAWAQHEREGWKREGEVAMEQANERSLAEAKGLGREVDRDEPM